MKIWVKGYSYLNVGDDLYMHLLFRRYKDIKFYFMPLHEYYEDYVKQFCHYPNVKVLAQEYSFTYRIKRKIGINCSDKAMLKKFDGCIYIAGSIFMENSENNEFDVSLKHEVKAFHRRGSPYFFLSCNFGPYFSKDYFEEKKKLFSLVSDVCFRDHYSKDLFAPMPNIRYAPDAIFSYNLPVVEKVPRTLGISVINLKNRKNLFEHHNAYIENIVNAIEHHFMQGYKVTLFSFCKSEGDDDAAEEIMSILTSRCKGGILTHTSYNGDMDSFLKDYASMERMIACRFHSMVLSVMLEQPVAVLSYSDKTARVIDGLELLPIYYKIAENIYPNWDNQELFSFTCDKEKLMEIRRNAQKTFEKTDDFLSKSNTGK